MSQCGDSKFWRFGDKIFFSPFFRLDTIKIKKMKQSHKKNYEELLKENRRLKKANRILLAYAIITLFILLYNAIA